MQNPPVASGSSASRMCTKTAAAWPSPAPNPETPCLSSLQKKDIRFSVFSTPPPKPASALLSPESMRETLFSPSFQQKDVLLFEWWLMKTEKGYNGKSLAVGGFTKRSEAVGIFNSAPIIKRHDDYTLETADGITVRIQGPINKTRTFNNGFPLEVSVAFLFGFPTTWDTFIGESSGDKPTHQLEITFDPSSQKRTVLLRNWWLRRAEKGSDGNTLAVGGFSERGKAMRIFNSSPITKRHDVCTIETADGITIRIQGFINKTRTLDNGFPLEACKFFFIGFPTTWTKFAILSSGDKPSHTETPVNTSISADWYKDFLENLPFGFPVPSENTNLENVPLTSKTSIYDFTAILLEAICKSAARRSTPSSMHSPLVDKGFHHLPAKKLCDNNCVQTDKICGTNVTYAQTVRKDYEDHLVECTPTNKCCTEAFHSEADGCQISNLHADGLPQEISVDHGKLDFIQEETLKNSKKCTGHALTTGHHDELVKICSTGVSSDFVIGKDLDKQERTVQKKDEKFYECSTGRIEKVRSGLTKPDNLHSEDQNFTNISAKPVRRSKRLRLQEVGNVQGDFQDYSQFLNETNKMDCAKLALDGSKTSAASQPNETLVVGSPSSSIFYREDQIFGESPAEPAVRKGERFELLTVGNVHGESQDYSQLLNETNNVNCATFAPGGPKISATSQLNDVLVQGRPSSPNLYGKIQEFVSSAKHAIESDRSAPALDGSKTYVMSLPSDTVLTEDYFMKKDEKFYECSTGRIEKVRSGLTKPDDLHSEDQNFTNISAKPVRRSKRLRLQEVGNVQGDFQDYSQFLNETNKMDCAKLALDGSKTSAASQPNETLVVGSPSSSIFYREDQIFGESPAEPAVRKGERFELLTVGNVHGESQDYSQLLNETNNVNCATFTPGGSKISATSQLNDVLVQGRPSPNLYGKIQEFVSSAKHASESDRSAPALDGSKTYVTSLPSDTVLTESILSPAENIRCPSAGVLSEENQDGHQHSNITSLEIVSKSNLVSKYDSTSAACLWKSLNDQRTFSCDPTVGIVEETPPNSKVFPSPSLGKNIMRHCKKIKDNQTVRNRMTVEQNDSRNRQDFSNSEENMSISSASNSRSKSLRIRTNYKTKNVGVSTDMGKPKCKGSRPTGCKTVWVSSYTDVHRAPLTQCKGIGLSFLTPEPLSLKRSRSGRLLLPVLDCSTRIIYEADGSIAGTASVDGSIARTSIRVMTSSQCNGSRTTPN